MGKVRTTICLPDELFAEVKKEARKCNMSISKFISFSLQEFLINQKKKKAAERVLNLIKENPLSEEAAEKALKELKSIEKEMENEV